LIKPHPNTRYDQVGHFLYSDEEFEIMLEDIKICKDLKVNGIVFGILNAQNKIDIEKLNK